MSQAAKLLRLSPLDNVAIATGNIQAGKTVDGVCVAAEIPTLHKVAIAAIPKGASVYRYGQPIGVATVDINVGDHVHTHNLGFSLGQQNYQFAVERPALPTAPAGFETFMGFRRPGGRSGTRNYLAVISSVNCSAHVARMTADRFPPGALSHYPNVDGILSFTHDSGCGIAQKTEAHDIFNRCISGVGNQANIFGYVLVGLGCEQGHPSFMRDDGLIQITDLTRQGERGLEVPDKDSGPIWLSLQSHGGTEETVSKITEYLSRLLPRANECKREVIPSSELVLGLNCGGSDAASGITANPALGLVSDWLVALGGTTVLAETPETVGAEHLLTRRAVSEAVGRRLVDKINWWTEDYTPMFGRILTPCPTVDNNPSFGNKAGGLTTIVEKSLGAVAKAGSTGLNHVLDYAAQIPLHGGLCFMDTPGFDPVSVTGLVSGGANIVVFTTGRGNCSGWAPVPTIKVATNTPMFERLRGDMDLNAGGILDGTSTLQEVGLSILKRIIEVASGDVTKSEWNGADRDGFVPWNIGPTM